MLTRSMGRTFGWTFDRIVPALARTGVHPNLLTALGLVANLWAAVSFATGSFVAAGGLMILAAAFDSVDGPVARAQGRPTKFGEFFDSIIDSYSDLILFLGLLVYYARVNRFVYAVLVCVAMAGSVMVSYARARAESLLPDAKMGFWERPERLALMILGALANRMAPALWVLAVGPNMGVVQRILRTRRLIRSGLDEAAPAAPGLDASSGN
jgi:CDP-diacylglycerol--glycerol-3-phosphate 3-phosphatidyltransferase